MRVRFSVICVALAALAMLTVADAGIASRGSDVAAEDEYHFVGMLANACSFSIISKQYGLTAGHCCSAFKGISELDFHLSKLNGKYFFSDKMKVNYPGFKLNGRRTTGVDACYFPFVDKDGKPVELDITDEDNAIVKLATAHPAHRTKSSVLGYGVTEEGSRMAPYLMKLDVDYQNKKECQDFFDHFFGVGVKNSATETFQNNKDLCAGRLMDIHAKCGDDKEIAAKFEYEGGLAEVSFTKDSVTYKYREHFWDHSLYYASEDPDVIKDELKKVKAVEFKAAGNKKLHCKLITHSHLRARCKDKKHTWVDHPLAVKRDEEGKSVSVSFKTGEKKDEYSVKFSGFGRLSDEAESRNTVAELMHSDGIATEHVETFKNVAKEDDTKTCIIFRQGTDFGVGGGDSGGPIVSGEGSGLTQFGITVYDIPNSYNQYDFFSDATTQAFQKWLCEADPVSTDTRSAKEIKKEAKKKKKEQKKKDKARKKAEKKASKQGKTLAPEKEEEEEETKVKFPSKAGINVCA